MRPATAALRHCFFHHSSFLIKSPSGRASPLFSSAGHPAHGHGQNDGLEDCSVDRETLTYLPGVQAGQLRDGAEHESDSNPSLYRGELAIDVFYMAPAVWERNSYDCFILAVDQHLG